MDCTYHISGCTTEKDVGTMGSVVASGKANTVAACRSFCRSKGAAFFTLYPKDTGCYCKNIITGRKKTVGAVTGRAASCTGQ